MRSVTYSAKTLALAIQDRGLDSLERYVEDQFGNELEVQFWEDLWNQLGNQLGSCLWARTWDCTYGEVTFFGLLSGGRWDA